MDRDFYAELVIGNLGPKLILKKDGQTITVSEAEFDRVISECRDRGHGHGRNMLKESCKEFLEKK